MKTRYGVVNLVERYKYEQEWQLPFPYEFVSWNKVDAINECRKRFGTVVEEINDSGREIIFENRQKDFTVS
jgi:hypothetical protein